MLLPDSSWVDVDPLSLFGLCKDGGMKSSRPLSSQRASPSPRRPEVPSHRTHCQRKNKSVCCPLSSFAPLLLGPGPKQGGLSPGAVHLGVKS